MKSKIYITGAAGFIGFHVAKKFLSKGIKVHGFDSINNYYDTRLKKTRLNILKKYKNFSFTKGLLENQKLLNQSVLELVLSHCHRFLLQAKQHQIRKTT